MADKYQLIGSWGTSPSSGSLLASGAPAFAAPINESMILVQKDYQDFDLVADTVVTVSFDGVVNANVINIFTDRKIKIRLTSADGALQSLPVDGSILLISKTVPYTALDLQRVAGQETRVKVFLGQKS